VKVAVMQPTYLPWMGYLALIDSVDIFVFYDDVQFEKQSWQQRNRIKSPVGKELRLTVPVHHNLNSLVNEVEIANSKFWGRDHWKSIEQSYSKAPFFRDYRDKISGIYQYPWTFLANLNIDVTQTLAKLASIKLPTIMRSSIFNIPESLHKTDRLAYLLTRFETSEYFTVVGTKGYLEVNKLEELGIKVRWFEYNHPVYPQINGGFIPYLSVIDLLFNTGPDSVLYIREGRIG
jgi:hypothetical protein